VGIVKSLLVLEPKDYFAITLKLTSVAKNLRERYGSIRNNTDCTPYSKLYTLCKHIVLLPLERYEKHPDTFTIIVHKLYATNLESEEANTIQVLHKITTMYWYY
jgi:hypothetical protein